MRRARTIPDSFVERPPRLTHAPIITVQQHILREQRRFPGASGEFSWLLSGITLATKMIEAKVRRAGLVGHSRRRRRASTSRAKCSRSSTCTPTKCCCTPGRPRQRGHDGLRGKRGAAAGTRRLAARQVHRRLRSARRLVEHRRQRERRHDLFDPAPHGRTTGQPGHGRRGPAAGQPSRSPPATSSTAPRRCWSTAPATACTASRSIRPSAPTCSATRTSACRRRASTTR